VHGCCCCCLGHRQQLPALTCPRWETSNPFTLETRRPVAPAPTLMDFSRLSSGLLLPGLRVELLGTVLQLHTLVVLILEFSLLVGHIYLHLHNYDPAFPLPARQISILMPVGLHSVWVRMSRIWRYLVRRRCSRVINKVRCMGGVLCQCSEA
jgi:hypothetical protein